MLTTPTVMLVMVNDPKSINTPKVNGKITDIDVSSIEFVLRYVFCVVRLFTLTIKYDAGPQYNPHIVPQTIPNKSVCVNNNSGDIDIKTKNAKTDTAAILDIHIAGNPRAIAIDVIKLNINKEQ